MRVAIVGTDTLSQNVAERLEKEGIAITKLDSNPQSLRQSLQNQAFDLFLALDNDDETNLVSCALVKQLGPIRTVASLKKEPYLFQKEVDLQRAFHIDHVVFPDLLVVDKIAQVIFEEGIYSRSFLHGNVLLRTMRVGENSSFVGKTLAEIREKHHEILVCLIHRPHKVLVSSNQQHHELLSKGDELVFAHGKDRLLLGDEITMIGKTDPILEACKELSYEQHIPDSVYIVGENPVGQALALRLKQHNVWVQIEPKNASISELSQSTVFVACHSDEEHNFVLALQAKDHGLTKVIAVLSDKATCEEADKLGITHVSSVPTSATDRLLELIQGSKVTSVMSLYDARAEILQVSVTVDSSIVGIPLSVLGPSLPSEILIGVIYTRGRIFIAGGTHILKPQDECLIITDPRHRMLLEKII